MIPLTTRKEAVMKAIGYIRVSTGRQAAEGVSLDAQEGKVRAWAGQAGASEVVIFRDEGLSGKKVKNRPGLQAALDAVGKGDVLVVYSLSRLSRSIRDTLNLSEHLQRRGADLVSLSEHIDTTGAGGRMVFHMLAVLAEYERELIGERVTGIWQYKRQRGEKTGGDVPFGYRVRKGRLYKDAQEQKAIALIMDLHGKGTSLRDICRALEAAGYSRKGGKRTWHPQAVLRIIKKEGKAE
jgi:site-specific DNA recombinase